MFTKLKELNAAFVLTPKKYPLFRFSEEQKKIKRKGSLMKVHKSPLDKLISADFPKSES